LIKERCLKGSIKDDKFEDDHEVIKNWFIWMVKELFGWNKDQFSKIEGMRIGSMIRMIFERWEWVNSNNGLMVKW